MQSVLHSPAQLELVCREIMPRMFSIVSSEGRERTVLCLVNEGTIVLTVVMAETADFPSRRFSTVVKAGNVRTCGFAERICGWHALKPQHR